MMPQINIPLLFLSAILMYILRSYEISKANSSIVPTSRADIIPSVLVSFKLTAILTLSRLGLAFFFFFCRRGDATNFSRKQVSVFSLSSIATTVAASRFRRAIAVASPRDVL